MDSQFKDLIAYFKYIASSHIALQHTDENKHFFRFELEEVLTGIRSSINYPALILEGYDFGYSDNNSDNLMKCRNGAFILLDHAMHADDFDRIDEIYDEMESIADDILAKIKADKRNLSVPFIAGFDINKTEGQMLKGNDQTFGIRITFTIDSPKEIVVNPEKWQ